MSEGAGGVSFAIADGVGVEVEPAEVTTIAVGDEPAPFEPVERVLSKLEVRAAVTVYPEVPLGHGFGASGAATLATAVAANAEFDLGLERESLVERAHHAEVEAGTGLGDVFIQDAGGLLWSADGDRHRVEVDAAVEYSTFGSVSTSEALGDDQTMARVREVGAELLDRLPDEPDLRTVTALSWEFAKRTDLVTDRVEREVERVRDAGGEASMAMLGETVFGVDAEGVLEHGTKIANRGAALQNS